MSGISTLSKLSLAHGLWHKGEAGGRQQESTSALFRSLYLVTGVRPKGRERRTQPPDGETVSSRADVDWQETLDDHHVPPYIIQLGVLFVHAHLAKAL